MTAGLEVSSVYFGIKGGFSLVLLEQIILKSRYLFVHPTKTWVRDCIFALFHHIPRGVSGSTHRSNIYS